MKTRSYVVLAALLALACAPAAHADKKDEAAIRACVAQVEKGFKTKNLNLVMSAGTPDFTETMGGQTRTAAQMKAQMAQEFKDTKSVEEMKMTVGAIKVSGSTAAADCVMAFKETVVDSQGQMGPKGKTHKMGGSGKSKLTFVKSNGKWLCKSEEVLSMDMTLDGKPFNPMAAAPTPPKKKK